MQKSKVQVGTDWTSCPCCHTNYRTSEPHHHACPIGISSALCRFCGIMHGRTHDIGCPHSTGLFPVLYIEANADLECARCETTLQLGDCFVAGKTAILCVGCAWVESAEVEGETST